MSAERIAPSEAIRLAVLDDGRPLRQIARSAGLPCSSISRFIRRQRGLSSRSIDRIADTIGVELRPVRRPP
jgi:hypothetical protein